jgi:hypothetical protein
MAAVASLEELREVLASLERLRDRFPEAYAEMGNLFRAYRKVGYKNICKLLLGESTPEKLKGGE